MEVRSTKNLAFFIVVLSCVALFFNTRTKEEMIAGFKKTDLQEVLKITNVAWDGKDVKKLVELTQKAWLRPAGKERWEAEPIFQDKWQQLEPVFKRMGLVDVCAPTSQSYEHILFMGATVFRMDLRMASLAKLLQHGLKYTDIVFLSGARALTEEETQFLKEKKWSVIPTTEAGVYPQMFVDYSIALKDIVFIDAPETVKPDGTKYRPTTADTVVKWLMKNPKAGTCLVISSQPFCHYQKVVTETLLPKTFTVDVAGDKAPESTTVAVYLDTLARTIYQWSTTQNPITQ